MYVHAMTVRSSKAAFDWRLPTFNAKMVKKQVTLEVINKIKSMLITLTVFGTLFFLQVANIF